MQMNSSVTIKSIRVRAVSVPMKVPHKTASGIINESPLVLTDVVTSEGTVGHSIVFTYTPAALKPTAELIRNMESLLINEKLAPIELNELLNKRFRLLGTQGLVGMSIAALDMAMWDALSRFNKNSLIDLLGGVKKQIPAYGAIGFDGVQGSASAAEQWAKKGFKGIKAKIGYPTIQDDVAVVRAMRQAAGDEMAIMVDYNQSLSTAEAIERLQVIDGEGLTWIEEPTLAHDYAGHAEIADETKTPIQCGENWWGLLDLQHAIAAKASDYMMLDVMKIGGVTGWLKAATMAQANNIRISSHLWPEISARLLSCTPTAHWLEYSDWWNPILENPLCIDRGMARVNDSTGSGIEWNENAVGQFLV